MTGNFSTTWYILDGNSDRKKDSDRRGCCNKPTSEAPPYHYVIAILDYFKACTRKKWMIMGKRRSPSSSSKCSKRHTDLEASAASWVGIRTGQSSKCMILPLSWSVLHQSILNRLDTNHFRYVSLRFLTMRLSPMTSLLWRRLNILLLTHGPPSAAALLVWIRPGFDRPPKRK